MRRCEAQCLMKRPKGGTRASKCAKVATKREFSSAATLLMDTSHNSAPSACMTFAIGTRAPVTNCTLPRRSLSTRHCTKRSFVIHAAFWEQRRSTRQESTSDPLDQKPFSQEPKFCNSPPVCLFKSGVNVSATHRFCSHWAGVGIRNWLYRSSCPASVSSAAHEAVRGLAHGGLPLATGGCGGGGGKGKPGGGGGGVPGGKGGGGGRGGNDGADATDDGGEATAAAAAVEADGRCLDVRAARDAWRRGGGFSAGNGGGETGGGGGGGGHARRTCADNNRRDCAPPLQAIASAATESCRGTQRIAVRTRPAHRASQARPSLERTA
mmetsp:Transcript_28914/g.83877  ORF Transcript_28914/g.83877 Transcript_28914/m.83877 type:complete len:324 (-) Transcript_28914:7-978(-)